MCVCVCVCVCTTVMSESNGVIEDSEFMSPLPSAATSVLELLVMYVVGGFLLVNDLIVCIKVCN